MVVQSFIAWSQFFVAQWGYAGLFLISFIGNATIIFPILPTFLIVFGLGSLLNPWLVALSAGLGAALGELIGYWLGRGGRKVLKSHSKWFKIAEKWKEKYSIFAIIIIFAATPLPDDVTGIMAGMINYNMKKFFIACLIGKIANNLALAWAGFFGIKWILNILGGV
jgi:membrane protein DedA with SNARE-associated domain